jgi:hypothetical protein
MTSLLEKHRDFDHRGESRPNVAKVGVWGRSMGATTAAGDARVKPVDRGKI